MLKKIFFSNLNPLILDEFFMKLLKQCGPLQNYKRPKNEKDVPQSFGCCEFETIDGVLKSLRILHGRRILDRDLSIKPDEKTEIFINEWLELKKREYEAQRENYPDI